MEEFNRAETARARPAPGSMLTVAMLCEAELWAHTQAELLSGVEALWASWLKRQSEAIDAGSHSLRQLFDCRNPAELARIQQLWVADVLRRVASDIGSLARDAAALTPGAAAVGRDRAHDLPVAPGMPPARSSDGATLQHVAAE
jgi:hypothetical protein